MMLYQIVNIASVVTTNTQRKGMVTNVIKGEKSSLDNLIEVLENMTDEEIVIATKNTSSKSDDDIDLSDFEFEYAPIKPKSTKRVMLLDLNQYSELKRLAEIGRAYLKWMEVMGQRWKTFDKVAIPDEQELIEWTKGIEV